MWTLFWTYFGNVLNRSKPAVACSVRFTPPSGKDRVENVNGARKTRPKAQAPAAAKSRWLFTMG